MVDLKQLTWSKVAMVVVMAVVPATLSYCQARQKASLETAQAAREADAGYKALAEAVKHLEMVVDAHNETLKLLGERSGVRVEMSHLPAGAGSAAAELPADNAAALRQQAL